MSLARAQTWTAQSGDIQFQWTRLKTSLPDKHYSLDSEDDFHSGC